MVAAALRKVCDALEQVFTKFSMDTFKALSVKLRATREELTRSFEEGKQAAKRAGARSMAADLLDGNLSDAEFLEEDVVDVGGRNGQICHRAGTSTVDQQQLQCAFEHFNTRKKKEGMSELRAALVEMGVRLSRKELGAALKTHGASRHRSSTNGGGWNSSLDTVLGGEPVSEAVAAETVATKAAATKAAAAKVAAAKVATAKMAAAKVAAAKVATAKMAAAKVAAAKVATAKMATAKMAAAKMAAAKRSEMAWLLLPTHTVLGPGGNGMMWSLPHIHAVLGLACTCQIYCSMPSLQHNGFACVLPALETLKR
ncbi:hypothetical protein VOLCADRAFT_93149 [Volvox carteri f. nagariensis]|uniref:Uncharacterized protein n=1 Tax=Volvox carteri f. nagariensis TaxID=3068 RepID=D8U1F5_VOLCA|nr:uncharacterized protein VOLCADRAFT_93149 [Volvox carteri f. nagariensis]EFJ46328.1 hypothetical protein VOLCADRAFT_93149 [Volvox carteri f. nagariensis]|eukprot:XP_002952481.1 hypothetical protein VOLCADRAFT_93149 [Volvox carteri f. nagariensis]